MPIEQSSWKVASWVTPSTQVTVDPIDASVSPESRSKISDRVEEQIPQFIRDDYGDFVTFLKYYYKGLELKGNPVDIIQNIDEYYNIDKLNDLIEKTTASSGVDSTTTVIDVSNTRDFPKEGLIQIDEEIIYYKDKSQTQFKECTRGFHATTKVGNLGEYTFASSTAATHSFGADVINLNNLLPLFLLQRFRDQFAESFPSKFDEGIRQSSVTKRLKDFYASKGTSRSFKYLMRVLFGVESTIAYPKDRIFKPSDAFYTVREVIRATAIEGNPVELTGEVLYQADDPNDAAVNTARIYVKSVVEVFTEDGKIYELDVDTENGAGEFTTPYKTILAEDLSNNLTDQIVTVDSTLGWPEKNGSIRINKEIINYTEKTVNQFLGCTRARQDTTVNNHIAGSEVTSSFEIYGYSNKDQSKITLKVYGGTRGVSLESGGKYYLQDSKVTTPAAPGFDSLEPIWASFVYNVKKLLNGTTLNLATPDNTGAVVATITTDQNHGLKRDDTVRILNAPEDVYNDQFIVLGVGSFTTFDIKVPSTPIAGINQNFLITREFAKATSTDTSIRTNLENTPSDVQNLYKSENHAIIASAGVPGHEVGPFSPDDLDPGNQRYLKRLPLATVTKSEKTATPVGQVGMGVNGVPFFSYKSEDKKLYGGVKGISIINAGDGYDITNPPIVEFEPLWAKDTAYFLNQRVRNSAGNRYKNLGNGKSAELGTEPTHLDSSLVQDGGCLWQFEGESAEATVGVSGRLYAVNVIQQGSGYIEAPTVAISGGTPEVEAAATATITNGKVTAIAVSASGIGYDSVPTVTISGGGGQGAMAEAVVRGGLETITVTSGKEGSNYSERPNVTLISGSGAVAYPSIVNGRIVSIILTYGGSNYYGPPDVVIEGDGVGAVAFATIDGNSRQVTSISVTNGGIGYTAGKTFVYVVYPGSGATFQVQLPELSINLAATPDELSKPLFAAPKVADTHNGVSIKGANSGIYGGEYGYLYNPRKLRFLLGDNVSDANNSELNPTRHSPIIGWAFDGHPIYGPYGYADRENKNPYNQLKQMISSYRVRSSRDALITGLNDEMGTYIEDYEYVEGLGDLDKYNGRFCVTPEFPAGVYAYFCTLDGTTGNPKFPYFVGPEFYSQADEVNWKGNGIQKNFTEDAVRYKDPYVYTDTSIVRRKDLGDPVNYVLALEDATTPIVLESDDSGTFIGFVDIGIGYYDYFPTVRGGAVDSLYVSATNRYFSSGLDQYLIEGPGFRYKVNDRLVFDETGTGGSGISARVSLIAGETSNALTYSVNSTTDEITAELTTATAHYVKVDDAIDITIGDNEITREIDVKIIGNKYHFRYFDLSNFYISSKGRILQANLTIVGGITYTNGTYNNIPLSGGTGKNASANITVSGNAVTSVAIVNHGKDYTDGDVLTAATSQIGGTGSGFEVSIGNVEKTGGISQDDWTIFAGSGYTPGTYTRVPLKNASASSGEDAEFTIVVGSGGDVESCTVTKVGSGYLVGEQLDPTDSDIGGGSGFYITPTKVMQEFTGRGTKAHQLEIGHEVVITGTNPADYDGTHTVTGISTGRKFQFKKAVPVITDTAIATNCVVYVKEAKLNLINGHLYKFKTDESSNLDRRLEFTFDKENTNVFTYKNVVDFSNDPVTGQQEYITIALVDVPGTLFYFDINGNLTGSYFSVINDPFLGSNTVTAVGTETTLTFNLAREPESAYSTNNKLAYSTNSIFPSGGISKINIGDPGRNYSTLPKFTGIERAGGGAMAYATISGEVEDVSVLDAGIGYNGAQPPAVVCSMPNYVDLTVEQVFGTFVKGDVVVSKPSLDTSCARGKVIWWDPNTSIVRVEPLRNNLTGAANRGFIMFTTGTAATNKIYVGSNQAVINNVDGTQAAIAAVVPSSGPDIGTITNMAVNNGGSNYRTAPTVYIDDPYYGGVATLSINSQNTSANFTAGTYTVSQESVAPTGGTGASISVVVNASTQDIESASVIDGGTVYSIGDLITIRGEDITGGTSNDDFVLKVETLTYVRKAVTGTTINASIDEVIVTNSGSGYLSAPDVEISGGTGLSAALRAEIIDETVSSIIIEAAGTKFQNPPIITVKQGTGSGASILLKSSDLGKIINLGGDNITYNYSHDRTLKPAVNTTYNLQLTRTQIVDFFTVTNGGYAFVTKPTIELVGGGGSGAVLNPIIDNEVIQAITIVSAGKGYSSTPDVQARMTHSFVALQSNSTLNFPYNTKIPLGTKVQLVEIDGTLPAPLATNTDYYVVAATIANGLADNQVKLATTEVNAINGTTITITAPPAIGPGGTSTFNLTTTDLGDSITVSMTPASFAIGEKLYQGTSTDSYSALGEVKAWDPKGRILSVEIERGEFSIGQPVFGLQSKAFGEIHEFDRSIANFTVSPIATATAEWKRTTGILDLNEQRIYDSDRYQEFSYVVNSPINVKNWKNQFKTSAHPAGFKVLGTQTVTQSAFKRYNRKSYYNPANPDPNDWWEERFGPSDQSFNGTTYFVPKPSASNTGKLAKIQNFFMGKPDYTATVPTNVQISGKQLLDVRKILSAVVDKMDSVEDRTFTFDGSSSSVVSTANDQFALTNHGFITGQKVNYSILADRYQDARDLILANIDYIIDQTISWLETNYPALTDGTKPDYDRSTCARDLRLVIVGWCNDLRYGSNSFTWDVADQYIGGVGVIQNKFADGKFLILKNKQLIAEEALGMMKANNPAFSVHNGNDQDCYDDIIDVLEAICYNMTYGGNSEVYDAAEYYVVGGHVDTVETEVNEAFNHARDLAIKVMQNYPLTLSYTTEAQYFDTSITTDTAGYINNLVADARTLIIANKNQIAACAVDRMESVYPSHVVTGGRIECEYDIRDFIDVMVENLARGGNDEVWDAANYYVTGGFVIGEEVESTYAFEQAKLITQDVLQNKIVPDMAGQVTDLTITEDVAPPDTPGYIKCASVVSTVGTLYDIVINAINQPLNHSSLPRTPKTGGNRGSCATVDSALTSMMAIITDAITNDHLNGITRTNPANHIYHIGNEEQETIAAIQYARDLALEAVQNQLPTKDNQITVDLNGCTDVRATITTLAEIVWKGIDNPSSIPDRNTGTYPEIRTGGAIGGYTVHAPTNAAYVPSSGLFTVTLAKHGFREGEKVQFPDNTFRFTCSKDNHATEHTYPRSTDPASGKWLEILAVTKDTFIVNVGITTDVSTHTFVSATGTHTFVSGASNAITVTGGATHTAASGTTYDPLSGDMVIEIGSHSLTTANTVTIADGAVTFTCSKDNHGSNHAYPRATDPVSGQTLNITAVTGTTITVNVTPATKIWRQVGSNDFYIIRVDDDNIKLAQTKALALAGSPVEITGLSTATQHKFKVKFDGETTDYQLRYRGAAQTPLNKNCLMVVVNGIVQNPASYTLSGSTITFGEAPLEGSECIIMHYKRSNIATNFQLDQFGDVITGLNTGDGLYQGSGYTPGTYNGVAFTNKRGNTGSGATGNIVVTNVLDRATHNTNNQYADARILIDSNAEIIADIAVGLLNKYGIATDNRVADGANLILMNKEIIAKEAVDRMHADIPYTIASSRELDAYNLLQGNREFLAEEAYNRFSTVDFPNYVHSQGYTRQDCLDDLLDIIDAVSFNLLHGANNKVYDAAYFYTTAYNSGSVVQGEEQQTLAAIGQLETLMHDVVQNKLVKKTGNRTLTPTGATYNPTTGWFTVTSNAHGLKDGDKIQMLDGAITMTCTYGTGGQGSYPRSTDPISGKWVEVVNVTENTFNVQVLDAVPSTNQDTHTWFSGDANSILVWKDHGYEQYTENTTYIFNGCNAVTSAITTLLDIIETAINTDLMIHVTKTEPTLFVEPTGDSQDCVDDVVDCLEAIALNLKFGGNSEVYDAAKYYVDGAHVAGEEIHTIYAFREANKLAQQAARNKAFNITGSHGLIQKFDGGLTRPDGDPCATVCSTIDTLWNIVEVAVNTNSMSTFTRTAPNGFTVPGLGPDQCKADTVDVLQAVGVNLAFGGNHVLWDTINMYFTGGHVVGEEAQTKYVFEEARQMALKAINNETFETYSNLSLTTRQQYKDPSITLFSTTQTASFTPTAATYTEATGALELTIGSHSLTTGMRIQIEDGSLTFKCSADGNVSHHIYPRSTDFAYGKSIPITGVTGTTITVNVTKIPSFDLNVTDGSYDPTTGDLTMKVYNTAFNVTDATYNATSGSMTVTIGSHSLLVGEHIMFAPNSLTFTCDMDENSEKKTYPSEKDPFYNKPLKIIAVTGTQVTVNVGTSPALTHDVTNGVYNPLTGDLELTIGNHILEVGNTVRIADLGLKFQCMMNLYQTDHAYPRSSIDEHTATGATFNTETGIVTITVNGHAMTDGDWVKLDDNALTFTCTLAGGNHSYPRASDPISGKWVKVSNCTTNTFDIQCLENTPCTNANTHTFVSGAANAIKQKRDRAHNNAMKISAKTDTTITVNVGPSSDTSTHRWKPGYTGTNVITSGGAHTHTWVGGTATNAAILPHGVQSQRKLTTETAAYNPTTGIVTLTVYNHGLTNTDEVKIVDNSLTFTCTHGGGEHSYPRASDPISQQWTKIDNITRDTFTIQCLDTVPSTNTTAHTFVSAAADGIIVRGATVKIADGALGFTCEMDDDYSTKTYPRTTTITHTVTDASYVPSIGKLTATVAGHGMSNGDYVKFADNSLTFSCPAATGTHTYTGGTVSNAITITAGSVQKDVTNATYDPATGLLELTIGSHSYTTSDTVTIGADKIVFSCDADNHATNHAYPRSSDPAYNTAIAITAVSGTTITCNVGIASATTNNQGSYPRATDEASGAWLEIRNVTANTFDVTVADIPMNQSTHTFVSATSGGLTQKHDRAYGQPRQVIRSTPDTITVNVGAAPAVTHTPSNAAYDPAAGTMEVTIGAHSLIAGTTVKLKENAISLSCTAGAGTHTYVGGTVGGACTIDSTSQTVTAATYNPANGNLELTIGAHSYTTSDTCTIATGALQFTCDLDSHGSVHSYPRTTDPAYNTALAIASVTGTTVTVDVGAVGVTSQTKSYPRAKLDGKNPTAITYTPATGVMACTLASHGMENGDWVRFVKGGVNFTCTHGDGTHSYPRATDPYYNKWLKISNVASGSFDVNVGISSNTTTHTFVAATGLTPTTAIYDPATGVMTTTIPDHGLSNGEHVKLDDGAVTFKCDYGVGSAHTWVGGTSSNAITITSGSVQKDVTSATYDPATGLCVMTIGSHSFTTSDTVTIGADKLSFTCTADGNTATKTYPRTTDPAYNTAIAITAVGATTITCNVGITSGNVATAYPRASDPISGKYVEVYDVTKDTFKIQVLEDVIATNTSTHTFVSAASNSVHRAALQHKRDMSFDTAVNISAVSATTITLDVGATSSTSTHTFQSALADSVISGGDHVHTFKSATNPALTVSTTGYTHTFLSATSGAIKNGQWGCTHVQSAIDTLMDLAYTAINQGNFSGLSRTVGNNGDGYETAPVITTSGGSPTTAGSFVPVLSKEGNIKSITVDAAGAGYANVPTITILSNTGSNATATATVSAGAITGITVTEGGYGYETATVVITPNPADTITTTAQASVIVGRYLDSIVVESTGKGYSSAPTLALTGGSASTAAGSIAAPTCTLTGAVTDVTLVDGGDNYKNTDVLGAAASTIGGTVRNDFQIEVSTVTFNGSTTAFSATVGGVGYNLPANDRFLLFLNAHIQELGVAYSYAGTPSTITFTEAPIGNMDFYCFYVGQLQDMDDLAPYFNGNKKTFILKKNDQPFSLESDSTEVIPANNLVMFLNGVYQEPEVAFTLNGSILEFSEAPRAGSNCLIYIYTGSDLDIVTEDTYSALDPGDMLQIDSEGDERKLATIASSTSLDTYEYTGLRPTVAEFAAVINNGKVTDVTIINPGSNYEVPPFLIFSGGGGSGAYAQTVIEQGSGRVLSVTNIQGGSNYNTVPSVSPYHPISLERTQRDRAVSNGVFLYTTQLISNIGAATATIPVLDAYYNAGVGFPTNGEIMIPFWNSSENVWGVERILYGSVDYSTNEFNGQVRGYKGTGPSAGVGHAITVDTGTFSSSGTLCTITMGAAHNLQTGMERYIKFTSAIGSYPATSLNGTYKVTRTADQTFTIVLPVSLTASGNMEILPTVRVYTV